MDSTTWPIPDIFIKQERNLRVPKRGEKKPDPLRTTLLPKHSLSLNTTNRENHVFSTILLNIP